MTEARATLSAISDQAPGGWQAALAARGCCHRPALPGKGSWGSGRSSQGFESESILPAGRRGLGEGPGLYREVGQSESQLHQSGEDNVRECKPYCPAPSRHSEGQHGCCCHPRSPYCIKQFQALLGLFWGDSKVSNPGSNHEP